MNTITLKDDDAQKVNDITLNFNAGSTVIQGDDGEWPEFGSKVDTETILKTNSGNEYNLGILKGEVGDDGILVASASLDDNYNLLIEDTVGNTINAGDTTGLTGDAGAEGLYPTAVSVDGSNHLILTINDGSTIDLGALQTRIVKIADVITTLKTDLDSDSNFIKLNDGPYTLDKANYPDLHFHVTNDQEDDLFTLEELSKEQINYYIKAL